MTLNHPTLTAPLRTDEHGAIRLGNTRVLLEVVIHAYQAGETPEAIVDSYPSLMTADVYAVIGYFLANRAEIDGYLSQREQETDEALRALEAARSPEARALRERLRAYQERTQAEK